MISGTPKMTPRSAFTAAGAGMMPQSARTGSKVNPPWGLERDVYQPIRRALGNGHDLLAAVAAQSLMDDGWRRHPEGFSFHKQSSGDGSLSARRNSKCADAAMQSLGGDGWSQIRNGSKQRRDSGHSDAPSVQGLEQTDGFSKIFGAGHLDMPPRKPSRTQAPPGKPFGRRLLGGLGANWSFDEEKEIQAAFMTIGNKAAQKYSSMQQALRFLDADRDGYVDRGEARHFFRSYDVSEHLADKVFEQLDREGAGRVPYLIFLNALAPAFEASGMRAQSEDSTRTPTPRNTDSHEERKRRVEEEFKDELFLIRVKSKEKFRSALEVRRILGTDENPSFVSYGDVRHFLRAFNVDDAKSSKICKYLDPEGYGGVDFHLFIQSICPHLRDMPGGNFLAPKTTQGYFMHQLAKPRRRSSEDVPSYGSTAVPAPAPMLTTGELGRPNTNGYEDRSGYEDLTEEQQEQLLKLMHDIGIKLQLKFKHVRDAFRCLDLSRDGRIQLTEMRSFIRGFGWQDDVAERLFTLLDPDNKGEVAYNEFLGHFEAALGGAACLPPTRKAPIEQDLLKEDTHKVLDSPKMRRIMNFIASQIGDELVTKYTSGRDALKLLDLNNDGSISRFEMRRYLRSKNFPDDKDATKTIFEAFGYGNDENMPLKDFVSLLSANSAANGLQSTDRWRGIFELRDLPRQGVARP